MSTTNHHLIEQKFRSAIQPLLSHWHKYKNAIYSELRLIQHDLQVQIAMKTGQPHLIFKEKEIPLFKSIASPTSKHWSSRIKEELEKLEYLRI